MLESVLKTSLIGLCNQVKARSGGNATVLACEEALLFKGGLKLTTKQDGDLRYFEDKGGKKYQVNEIVALASEQNKGMLAWTSEW